MRTFVIASNNLKKVRELNRILIPMGIMAKTPKEMNITLDDVEETGTTFIENARLKARAAYKLTGLPCIADDSGLMVDALNGAPGVYSARYSGENATDEKNNAKLLEEMKDIPDVQRNAKFVCVICCILENGKEIIAHGECVGKIGYNLIGEGGFGYDPLFMISGGKSFAQLTAEEKDKISHRGNALRILKEQLKKYITEEK
ncbi:MAG: RdgB/HAM1 family non-canonical purine NTP pyrophosphatase [Acutalibacteraceae bacterium]|nr:RdgB/HAM1 family non-canonical purine NTP pyrophosphatase [Acutalibacteraceae bacterium]